MNGKAELTAWQQSSRFILAILAAALTSCDTSGVSSGIEGTGSRVETMAAVSRGPIQSKEGTDLKVNGTTWSAAAARVTIDGAGGQLLDLARGTIVTVQGERTALDRALASSIETRTTLRGPIRTLDSATGHLEVLGQTVLGDENTVLDIPGGSLDALYVGEVVAISGFLTARGRIQATRISSAVQSGGLPWIVSGIITAAHSDRASFEINDLVVSYAQVLLPSLPRGALDVGQSVIVSGSAVDSEGVLLADSVAPYTEALPPVAIGHAQVSGIVHRIESDDVFYVNAQRVVRGTGVMLPETVFEGSYVRVAGSLSHGVLNATEIFVVGRGRSYMLDGPIESVDVGSRTFRILGTQLFTNDWTRLGSRGSLSDFAVGEIVSVWAYDNGFVSFVGAPWPNHPPHGIEGAWFNSIFPPRGFTVRSIADFEVQLTATTRFFLTYRAGDGECYGADKISTEQFWDRAAEPRPSGHTSIFQWGHFAGGVLIADEVWICYP